MAQQIDTLGAKDAALSEQYNETVLEVQAAQADLTHSIARASQADADAAGARSLLRDDSVDAYIDGGTTAATGGGTVDAQTAILRAAYVQTLASTQRDHLDGFCARQSALNATRSSLVLGVPTGLDRRVGKGVAGYAQAAYVTLTVSFIPAA